VFSSSIKSTDVNSASYRQLQKWGVLGYGLKVLKMSQWEILKAEVNKLKAWSVGTYLFGMSHCVFLTLWHTLLVFYEDWSNVCFIHNICIGVFCIGVIIIIIIIYTPGSKDTWG